MYKTIVADPAWRTTTGGSKHLNPMAQYPVQTREAVVDTMKSWLALHPPAEESHLYLWCLNTFSSGKHRGPLDGVWVCEQLGFKPITQILWLKPDSNPTPYGQRASEICIFATKYRKGKGAEVMYKPTNSPENVVGPGLSSSIDWFIADRRQHSRKPDEFYDIVEQRSEGPYLEMYSRTSRPGWTALGNQVGTWKII
jgi:hypothetical protein